MDYTDVEQNKLFDIGAVLLRIQNTMFVDPSSHSNIELALLLKIGTILGSCLVLADIGALLLVYGTLFS